MSERSINHEGRIADYRIVIFYSRFSSTETIKRQLVQSVNTPKGKQSSTFAVLQRYSGYTTIVA